MTQKFIEMSEYRKMEGLSNHELQLFNESPC